MIYIIIDKEKAKEFDTPGHAINVIETINGDWVTGADILTDEKTWGHAFEYLNTCQQIELTKDDFKQPEIPFNLQNK